MQHIGRVDNVYDVCRMYDRFVVYIWCVYVIYGVYDVCVLSIYIICMRVA